MLIAYFLGQAWAKFLPRGDRLEARWRAKGGQGKVPFWIALVSFFNYGEWGLKEHAICSITATAASNAAASSTVFSAQLLFYDLPLSPTTVVLTVISIGLFGYGLCGILRPVTVWHVDAVYWSTLPTVKTLQVRQVIHQPDVPCFRFLTNNFTTTGTSLARNQIVQAYPILLDRLRRHVLLRVLPCLYLALAERRLHSLSRLDECDWGNGRHSHPSLWRFSEQ